MSWLVFWSIVGLYWAIGIKRMPTYFHRVYDHQRAEWRHQSDLECQKIAAWGALGLAAVWPYYEGGRWLRDHIINTMTAEQRRQKEYEKAEQIVTEYKKRQEQEERAAFDRELKGEK